MREYFYIEDGERKGPFTIDELKTSKIHRNSLVWYEGSADWCLAKTVDDLRSFLEVSPPPVPGKVRQAAIRLGDRVRQKRQAREDAILEEQELRRMAKKQREILEVLAKRSEKKELMASTYWAARGRDESTYEALRTMLSDDGVYKEAEEVYDRKGSYAFLKFADSILNEP